MPVTRQTTEQELGNTAIQAEAAFTVGQTSSSTRSGTRTENRGPSSRTETTTTPGITRTETSETPEITRVETTETPQIIRTETTATPESVERRQTAVHVGVAFQFTLRFRNGT